MTRRSFCKTLLLAPLAVLAFWRKKPTQENDDLFEVGYTDVCTTYSVDGWVTRSKDGTVLAHGKWGSRLPPIKKYIVLDEFANMPHLETSDEIRKKFPNFYSIIARNSP